MATPLKVPKAGILIFAKVGFLAFRSMAMCSLDYFPALTNARIAFVSRSSDVLIEYISDM